MGVELTLFKMATSFFPEGYDDNLQYGGLTLPGSDPVTKLAVSKKLGRSDFDFQVQEFSPFFGFFTQEFKQYPVKTKVIITVRSAVSLGCWKAIS